MFRIWLEFLLQTIIFKLQTLKQAKQRKLLKTSKITINKFFCNKSLTTPNMNYQPSKQQNKNAQVKAWKQNLLIDKRQVQSQEKDIPKLFSFCNTVHECNDVVNKMLKQNETKELMIAKQEKKIFARLNDLSTSVNDLKQTLKYYEYTNQYLVKVQNLSECVYSRIQKIKQNMSSEFEALLQAEQTIQNDLKLYDHKVEMIISGEYDNNLAKRQPQNQIDLSNKQNKRLQSAAKKSNTLIKPQINIRNNEQPQYDRQAQLTAMLQNVLKLLKNTETQVEEKQSKINALGKNLGWNEEDHSDFIKIWNRCQGKNYFQIQSQLTQYFKFYTEQQIRDHMNKYMKHKQLNQQKKQIILQYKHLKQERKVKEFQILVLQDEKNKKVQNKQLNAQKSQEEQFLMKQKVYEWKKIKSEKYSKQQTAKRQQQERKINQMMRKNEQNLFKRQAVQKWKDEQQQLKTRKMRQSRDTKRTIQTIDKETQQRIRQRQQKLIAEKIQKAMKKKYDQEERLQKQQILKEKKMVKYSYVNSKLQQKTTAIKEKQREKFDGKNKKDANTFGGNLIHAGIRATPTWMQGL